MSSSFDIQSGVDADPCSVFERPLAESVLHGVLTLAIVSSFVPQWLRQYRSKHRNGMSIASALMLAIVSTEHLALTILSYSHPVAVSSCVGSASPLSSASIVVALLQPTMLWLCCMLQFLSVLSVEAQPWKYTAILAPYICFFLLPVVWFPPLGLDDSWLRWATSELLRPVTTLLCLLHSLPQLSLLERLDAYEVRFNTVLSRLSIIAQGVLFASLSVCWSVRGPPPVGDMAFASWRTWYAEGGWAVVNYAVLSFGQWRVLARLGALRKEEEQESSRRPLGDVKVQECADVKPTILPA